MSDFEPRVHYEKPNNKSEKPSQSKAQNFQKTAEKITKIHEVESEQEANDFLKDHEIPISVKNREKLLNHVEATRLFFPDFSIYDLSSSDLNRLFGKLKNIEAIRGKSDLQERTQLNQAQSAGRPCRSTTGRGCTEHTDH